MSVAILVPVLNRPQRVEPFLESVLGSMEFGPDDIVLFLLSPEDREELAAVQAHLGEHVRHEIVPWEPGDGDFARKINLGVAITLHDWVFVGADDLDFHQGWFETCLSYYERTGAKVIGVNDLGNVTVMRGHYATHMLVHRSYATDGVVDDPGKLLCELYSHNCVDTELVETARGRGEFVSAREAHVEHLHHIWRKAKDDATYAKGRKDHPRDRALLQRRRRLWARNAVLAHEPVQPQKRRPPGPPQMSRLSRSAPTKRWPTS